ncbi:MAG: preprotein translocase subunit SecE [Saccharofermentanales bacterium]
MADKEKKAGGFTKIGKRIVKFFIELRAELKKVVWPDRKKLTQSTVAVVGICVFAAILIFTIDQILSGFLGAVGFFPETSSTAAVSNLLPTGVPGLTATIPPSSSASSVSTTSSQASATVSSASVSAS